MSGASLTHISMIFQDDVNIITTHFSLTASLQNKNSEYDQDIPQSQTADNPMAPRGRATQPSRDTRKTNQAKQPAIVSPSR